MRLYLPQCEICKYYEFCVTEKVDRKSIWCLGNFYVNGVIWDYYKRHINEYAVPIDVLTQEICKEK